VPLVGVLSAINPLSPAVPIAYAAPTSWEAVNITSAGTDTLASGATVAVSFSGTSAGTSSGASYHTDYTNAYPAYYQTTNAGSSKVRFTFGAPVSEARIHFAYVESSDPEKVISNLGPLDLRSVDAGGVLLEDVGPVAGLTAGNYSSEGVITGNGTSGRTLQLQFTTAVDWIEFEGIGNGRNFVGLSLPVAAQAGTGYCAQTVDHGSNLVSASQVGNDCVISFSGSKGSNPMEYSWTPNSGVDSIWLLAVGGGGAGGTDEGGGGGAGLFVEYTNLDLSSHISGGAVDIEVGNGGVGRYWDGTWYRDKITDEYDADETNGELPGANGGDSIFGTITADGGGGGGTADNDTSAHRNGRDGGSGGGGAGESGMSGSRGGTTATGGNEFGNLGGNGDQTNKIGGGGGGAGSRGLISEAGSAKSSAITGSSVNYAAGGGGGRGNSSSNSIMSGGSGIGGSGGNNTTEASNGQDGTGSGGGEGGGAAADTRGTMSFMAGDGGDGIVIVRYSLVPEAPSLSAAGTNGGIAISYAPPDHTGGSAINDYEYSLDAGGTWTSLGETDGTSTISGLTNNTSYSITLRAINADGFDGAASSPVSVTPSGAGEILRFDATHPDSFQSGNSTWADLASSVDATPQGGAADNFNSRTKSFDLDGSDDHFSITTTNFDFSQGLAIHATADFGEADSFERLIDFGNGSASDNFFLGRRGTTSDLQYVVWAAGVAKADCRAVGGIIEGVHTYSVVIDPTSGSPCSMYRDGV